ncbi:complex III assembly factor LYRM7-like [Actinia tenebrosa]|uniref:Complex III assembly factor LYRM7 n=1 Tax=Actinia tenebrosa TaxID=6105 RepID=A0A6P8IP10_ACTTE|nr:complex III assembly factor LYRM7-like [Actinia tenebrosa]
MSTLRSKVLACYKSLHRARLKTFVGDAAALEAGRKRIRQEFIKNKNEKDITKIEELLKTAKDVEKMMLQYVVQGVYKERENKYHIRITEDTALEKNAPLPAKK